MVTMFSMDYFHPVRQPCSDNPIDSAVEVVRMYDVRTAIDEKPPQFQDEAWPFPLFFIKANVADPVILYPSREAAETIEAANGRLKTVGIEAV